MTSGRYRRLGTVRATRLTTPLEWTTSRGSALRGEVGDWVVESATVGRHTVAAAEFPRLYEWVGGDTFLAIGEVDARQTMEEEHIATLEGSVRTAPGDWVITDDRGNSWPLPDSVFRETYEEVS